ncbi:hypothetical protein [Psychroflexus sp. MES1-P1E]|uniref:hypothetical protein n=1 Tax=Psychroflexus sp. MES1-P1E TaxID=2058320 RepID=UPI000C79CFCF|nr:hypothetical protein [Psychroflexus sp. MES1-P1E]PKG42686.1 hypothetical protein CXF67_08975 [Psychroflexus sp. MES1-P1E]
MTNNPKTKIENAVNILIEKCIYTQKVEFPKMETDSFSLLLEKQILLQIESNPEKFKINPNSLEFNKTLL